MSPEELLQCSDAGLEQLAVSARAEDLLSLFDRIWEKIRPLYAGQPKSAEAELGLSLAQAALGLASHTRDRRLLIEAWHMMGRCSSANEEFEQAIPFYRLAISGLNESGDSRQSARLHLALIGVLLNADRYAEAFETAAVAEGLFRSNNDEMGLARLYHNIANIYHRTDNHTRAYDYYQQAYETFQRLGDKPSIAHSCFNLGNTLAEIDQFDKSDEMYARSIELSLELGLPDLWTQANYNRAYLHYLRGRYSAALESFSRLRHEFERSGSTRHHALCDLDESEIYLQLNLSRDAAALAIRAAANFGKLGLRYEHAKATAFYGVALMQQRRFSDALAAFGTSQRVFEQENNQYWIGLLDLYRAEVHLSLERYWDAHALAAQAKTRFDRLSIPSKRIFSLVLLGRAALALNDASRAAQYSAAITAIVSEVQMPLVLFPYHVLCAEIAERTDKRGDAQRHYEAAVLELERHQTRLHHDDLRVTFFQGRHQVYDALIRMALDAPDQDEALTSAYAWCERARSRGLIELLSQHSAAARPQVEQSLLAKIDRLREELNTHYARSKTQMRPVPSAAEFEAIDVKEHELTRTLRQVSAGDPEYTSLHQVSIATLDSVRTVLPKETTLIEFFTAGDEILVFVIAPDGARVIRKVCPISKVAGLQERLGFHLGKFSLGNDYVSAHAQQMLESANRTLNELYRYLLAPFVNEIATPHLVIVPHGSLHFLPFHAFYDGEQYLTDKFEISYAPSASILKYCLEKEPLSPSRPLLIGVADERAPLVAEEITRLQGFFPNAQVLLNEAATREAFVSRSADSTFLHIATHAVFRQDNPMFSSFKLADGWFTAFDLFSLVCPANLVTLSGCQSGMSEVTGSDDLLGLMRGFLYAGARSMLLSLWNVNDESTTGLMTKFYEEWCQGAAKSTALRRAMHSVREAYPNPFHWASFLLVGNP